MWGMKKAKINKTPDLFVIQSELLGLFLSSNIGAIPPIITKVKRKEINATNNLK